MERLEGDRREDVFRFGMNEPRNENDWHVVLRVDEQVEIRFLRGATFGLVFGILTNYLFPIEAIQDSPNIRALHSIVSPILYSLGCALLDVYQHVDLQAYRILQR